MSPVDQVEYFRVRAKVERDLAEQSGDSIVGRIHRELADRYEAAIERVEHRPTLRIVAPSSGAQSRSVASERDAPDFSEHKLSKRIDSARADDGLHL